MGRSNNGSSMPNQGDRGSTSGSAGKNQQDGSKSGSPKYSASVHKGKSLKRGKPPWM